MHDVFGSRFLPQCKVGGVAFFLLTVESACSGEKFVDVATREFAIVMVAIVLRHNKVNRTLTFVGISAFKNFLDIFDLLNDVARCVRLN